MRHVAAGAGTIPLVPETFSGAGHRDALFDARSGVADNLIELVFRFLERGRHYSSLAEALRLALLCERTSCRPASRIAAVSLAKSSSYLSVKDVDGSNRGIQRRVIVDRAGKLLADLALQ